MSTILYIDDDENACRLAKIYLSKYNHRVFPVRNTKRAHEILQKQVVDLVIFEVGVSVETGMDFHKELSRDTRYSKIPVIFVSGEAISYDESLLSEKEHVILKPLFFPVLADKIAELTRR